jgi:hypothetical protein
MKVQSPPRMLIRWVQKIKKSFLNIKSRRRQKEADAEGEVDVRILNNAVPQYMSVDLAASQNDVCKIQDMFHIFNDLVSCSMIKDESNNKCTVHKRFIIF